MTSQSHTAEPAHNETYNDLHSTEGSSNLGAARVGLSDNRSSRHRRHRTQPSSSFRLGPPSKPRAQQYNNNGVFTQHGAKDQKSYWGSGSRKRQAGDNDLTIPKRHSRHSHYYDRDRDRSYRPLLGSSPLAYNVPQTPEAESSSSRDVSTGHIQNSPAVGLDSDPAEMVKLALSLNESRKRSSLGRSATGGTHRRRTISAGLSHLKAGDGFGSPNAGEGDWQFVGGLARHDTAGDSQEQSPDTLNRSSLPSAVAASFANTDLNPPDFSAATLARAEKARKHFELFEEYLRLLPHLPPLPTHGGSLSATDNESTIKTREYNPLQYIRNSKVRYRDRKPLDSQAEGWDDTEKVRDWVDVVVTNYGLSPHKPNECLQLPSLASRKIEDSGPQVHDSLQPSKSNISDSGRPRRPRRDWFTSPSDLLADAAWLETGDNKTKIEDANGNKLFPSSVKLTPIRSTALPEPPAPVQEESPRIEDDNSLQSLQPTDALPTFTSVSDSTKRGRRKHRLAHSLHLTPSHSHSRTRSTSGWRKRSASASSRCSSGSDNESHHWGKKFSRLSKKHSAHGGKDESDLDAASVQPDSQSSLGAESNRSPGKSRGFRRRTLLPPLDIERAHSTSPLHSPSRTAFAPLASKEKDEKSSARASIEEIDTAQSSPAQHNMLPSITISLSPTQSMSPLSSGHPLLQSTRPLHERSENNTFNPVFSSPPSQSKKPGIRRTESSPTKMPRASNHQESKIRGMFKGGRIAEIVGNEVSKVGDFIRKKEHSRQSSSASSILSELGQSQHNEMTDIENAQAIGELSHLRSVRSWDSPKYQPPVLHGFTPTRRNGDEDHIQSHPARQALTYSNDYSQGRIASPFKRNSSSLIALNPLNGSDSIRESPGVASRPDSRRPKLTNVNRLSSRNISTYPDSININRREIARVRARLLSIGVKALELRRHAEMTPGICFESWVNGEPTFDAAAPYIACSEETITTAQKFVTAFDNKVMEAQGSLMDFSTSKIPGLKSDLERLERFFETSIAPRTNDMVTDLDDMTNEVSTTGTLAINQLHEALDKGIRKRNRRFRWASRLGYVFLEWVLVGVMWWVWMVVMVWKVFRGVWRGTVSGIRWVLWL